MKYLYQLSFLLFFVVGHSQTAKVQKQYSQIPLAYQSHPELGKITHSNALNEAEYELIQDRTQYSRTFLNTNKTKTTVQSSVPLHYQSSDGFWNTIEYKLARNNNKIVYPVQNPFFEFDADHTSIAVADQRFNLQGTTNFIFIADGHETVKTFTSSAKEAILQNDNQILLKNSLGNVDKTMTIYHQAVKVDYLINNASFLPAQLDNMVVEEVIDLPSGYSMQEEKSNGKTTNRLVITNQKGEEVLVFQQPVISDSKAVDPKFRYFQKPYEAKYTLVKLSQTKYKVQINIEGQWLKSADRVFPIVIDPVVTINNNNVVNSCFLPSYEQSTLQVAVPAGQTILSSDISYDFVAVAGSGSYMADQRSFVSGPIGQTPVASGVGNAAGTYITNFTNSSIANIVSAGQIDYTFNFSRNWGGSGCNATYNMVDHREVAVTYGTIEFGNGPLLINEFSASNQNFNDR
jgi:hypothetical protein